MVAKSAGVRLRAMSSSSVSLAPDGRRVSLPKLPSARPSVPVRLLARLRTQFLDDKIAGGADVVRSRLLSARAEVLISRRTRLDIAEDLEAILRLADGPFPRRMGGVPLRRSEVRAAGSVLRDLIEALRGPTTITPRGIAIARALVHGGRTPVYARAPSGALTGAVLEALACATPA
jgi:hypothetical protein